MGEILGLGATHYPSLTAPPERMLGFFHHILSAPNIDPKYKDRANWPREMLAEMGNDEGRSSIERYRERMWANFRKQRQMIDDFAPDFIVLIGDDQYENFREDIIPPFCVYGLDDEFDLQPWQNGGGQPKANGWGESGDWTMRIHGHRDGAKQLTTGLIRAGVPMPYAYKPLHLAGLGHAFTNTLLFLDCDRRGFPHPVVPFHVNCYGSMVMRSAGAVAHLFKTEPEPKLPDPPAPTPALCMSVGAALARVIQASPYRIVLMASSSWSHCFLSPVGGWVIPDHVADREMLAALRRADWDAWRNRSLEQIERAGHHELLNWMVLAGAMAELDRKPVIDDWVETYIFQSDKCFASFAVN
jgi:hypothetical protein